jgi:hypothetical protein
MNYIRRKKPELWGNPSLPIFPCICSKVRPRAMLGPRWRPLGKYGGQAADCPRASLSGNRGKRYLSKGISRENSEAAWTPGEKVVSRSYQPYFLIIFDLT